MKPIPNYPNYSVTKDGKVINNKFNRELKATIKDGYCQVNLSNQGKSKIYKIHRLVANAFIINVKNKKEVNHINGIKNDNRVENLEWVTGSENLLHAYKFGLKSISDKQKKIYRELYSKIVLDTQTGIFYDSAKVAAQLLGINKKTLYGYLSGHKTNKTSLIYA